MAIFPKRLGTRRSLLAPRKGDEKPWTLWRKLAVANIIMVVLVIVLTLTKLDTISPKTPSELLVIIVQAIILMGLIVNSIMLLAHLGSRLVRRHIAGRSTAFRVTIESVILMLSTTIVLGLLLSINNSSITVNGTSGTAGALYGIALASILSAVFGISALVLTAAVRRRRARSVLLSQGDLLTAEFQAARSVQQSLLPDEDARLFGFDISGKTTPAVEIGGDYYDYLTFADGTKGILVADAAGKGIPAALVMAKFQGMAQALSIHIEQPQEFFVGLNDTLRIRLDRQSFITVGMLTIDFEDHISFFRAGHNPLFLYCASSGSVETLKPQGMALGLAHGTMLGRALQPCSFVMQPGDVALLYSDGLNEATNSDGEEYGDDRIAARLRSAAGAGSSAAEIRTALFDDLRLFVGDAEPHDDVTVVVVKKV
jgi:serine phosphatase RsbU (regulator of sigma subunit)